MNSVFITGTSTVGKTHLANKLAASLGIKRVGTDAMRIEMLKDPLLEPWVNFYFDKDKEQFLTTTTCAEKWQKLVNQSEAFWPTIKKNIEAALASGETAIFEGVNLLPHLMKEIEIKGVVLSATSEEDIFERLKLNPRWGKEEKLQRLEAHNYFTCEGPGFLVEAEQFGIQSFSDISAAEIELRRLILS